MSKFPPNALVRIARNSLVPITLYCALSWSSVSFVFGQEGDEASTERIRSVGEFLEQGGFFEDDAEDSLSELLRKAREQESSTEDEGDVAESGRRDENGLPDIGEPDAALDDFLDDEDEEKDQAEEEMKANQDRQRAMIRHLQRLQKPIHQIRLSHVALGANQSPQNRAADALGYQAERWVTATGATPRPSNRYPTCVSHRPLYFEEIDLERCGKHHGCVQNLMSSCYFLTNAAALPYRLATQRPDCQVPSRGDCRSCHTFSTDIEPLVSCKENASGIVTQAAAIAGFTFLML